MLLIISPKLMNKSDNGFTFSIESETQYSVIGYS